MKLASPRSWSFRFAGTVAVLCGVLPLHAHAQKPIAAAPIAVERKAILDAIRPIAATRTRQPVRIVVEQLRQVRDWAVVEGTLTGAEGRPMNWSRASECEPELDKILWAVLQKRASGWQVMSLAVCAPEPPYWDPQFFERTPAPCAVFDGLVAADGVNVAQHCRNRRPSKGRSRIITDWQPRENDVRINYTLNTPQVENR